jgi:hypothetical protein
VINSPQNVRRWFGEGTKIFNHKERKLVMGIEGFAPKNAPEKGGE